MTKPNPENCKNCSSNNGVKYKQKLQKSERVAGDLCVSVVKTTIAHRSPAVVVEDLNTSSVMHSVLTGQSHYTHAVRPHTLVKSGWLFVHCVSKKFSPLNSLKFCQILKIFALRMKFATKPIRHYPSHFRHVATLAKILKIG